MPDLSPADELVAANIRRLREHRGLTQSRVAELAVGHKLSETSLWHLENGRRHVKVSDLCAAAAALDVDPAELLREDFDPAERPQTDEGPRAATYQVVLDGGASETVTAHQSFVDDDQWINFYLRGERVFFAPASRVAFCRTIEEAP